MLVHEDEDVRGERDEPGRLALVRDVEAVARLLQEELGAPGDVAAVAGVLVILAVSRVLRGSNLPLQSLLKPLAEERLAFIVVIVVILRAVIDRAAGKITLFIII